MQPTFLSSSRNPLLQRFRRALRRGELTPDGCCAVEGAHLVEEALRSNLEIVAVLAARSAQTKLKELVPEHNGRPPCYLTSDRTFRALAQTETPQGIAALVRLPPAQLDQCLAAEASLTVVLVGLQDPGNLGTILRSLEAFGGAACVLAPASVSPYNPKAVRASAGSLFRVPVFRNTTVKSVVRLCAEKNVRRVALVPRAGTPLGNLDLRGRIAFFVGGEAHGLDAATLAQMDDAARIPLAAPVESLNAAVAASLALYEAARQRNPGN